VRRTLTLLMVAVLMVTAVSLTTGCERKVTVLTGEIVLCTAGEIIEDNTEEVEVPASQVSEYGVTTRVITCDEHGDLAAAYAAAQKAIAEGDLVTARERLRTVLDRDPTYGNAADQLAEIDAGRRPAVDSGSADAGTGGTGDTGGSGDTGGGTVPSDDPGDTPQGPVVSLVKWVPDTIEGYVAQGILADLASLSRQYIPLADSADQLMIEVQQHVNAEAAVAAQTAIAGQYPDSTTSRTIGGKTVMAGVKGGFAAGVFIDGPITVTVELHATSGSGSALIDAVFDVVTKITR